MTEESSAIRFGTDGWRGVIARDFTFANVRRCAQAVSDLLYSEGLASRGLVVGYDTRFASEEFANEVTRVISAQGIKTYLCDRSTPTPAVSYGVLQLGAGAGVIITASHNAPSWNGFKYKPEYAGSASPEIVARLESFIANIGVEQEIETLSLDTARSKGLLTAFNPTEGYLEKLGSLVDLDLIRNAGLRIVVDSMHGSGATFLAKLLEGGRTTVTELRGDANPRFPGMDQPEPILTNLRSTSRTMREHGFNVGFATDGDADRLGVLDERGEFMTSLQVFSLLCLHMLEVRGLKGPIVKSLTQSNMINRLGEIYDVPIFTTEVGFKYLGPTMMRENALAAGEESGGYAFRGHIPERDGLLSALLFLELMVKTKSPASKLGEWLQKTVGPHHFDRKDITIDPSQTIPSLEQMVNRAPEQFGGLQLEEIDTKDGVRFVLEHGFWGLIRPSGTEPVLRLYAEAETPARVKLLLETLESIAKL